jgi:hypothetical protein
MDLAAGVSAFLRGISCSDGAFRPHCVAPREKNVSATRTKRAPKQPASDCPTRPCRAHHGPAGKIGKLQVQRFLRSRRAELADDCHQRNQSPCEACCEHRCRDKLQAPDAAQRAPLLAGYRQIISTGTVGGHRATINDRPTAAVQTNGRAAPTGGGEPVRAWLRGTRLAQLACAFQVPLAPEVGDSKVPLIESAVRVPSK